MSDDAAGEELLTKGEVADLLRISERTLERMTRDGTGPPSITFGRSRRWFRKDVLAWAKARRDPPACPPAEA